LNIKVAENTPLTVAEIFYKN